MPEFQTPFVHVFTRSKQIVAVELTIEDDPVLIFPPVGLGVDFKATKEAHEFVCRAIVLARLPEPRWYVFGGWVGTAGDVYFELSPSEAGDLLLARGRGDKLTDDILKDPDWSRPREWSFPKLPDPTSENGSGPAPRTPPDPSAVPPLESLRELHDALIAFVLADRDRLRPTYRDEEKYLPRFARLADALRPVRPVIGSIEGWPPRVGRAIRAVIASFDATAAAWGWEGVAAPEPGRSAYVAERRTWFRETVERPYYEAAISWQAGCRELTCPVDEVADEGRRLGFSATMSDTEGRERFPEARDRWQTAPRLGKCCPKIGEQERGALAEAYNLIRAALEGSEPPAPAAAPEAPPHNGEKTVCLSPSAEPSTEQPQAPARKRRGKGAALTLLLAALETLEEKGQWGWTDKQIIDLIGISRSTFYRLTRDDGGNDAVKSKLSAYRRKSVGRGPARPGSL